MRPDSHWQSHWRGDTTERSRLLLQVSMGLEIPLAFPQRFGRIMEGKSRTETWLSRGLVDAWSFRIM